ncbi:hypothetical protein [Pseudoalteromonas luteoviolacea]|uniref:hypothetical protein n=1 Tax=Pseudoalteromonas luteoviolacea TaxID=43657 RepID=UPI001B37CD35|nr:hypothetical protein [Pseudoalteromonas luteoviolacea]MBQ4836808.1 hypothetical protein [Pseudoalteromonas luteoviolacea]
MSILVITLCMFLIMIGIVLHGLMHSHSNTKLESIFVNSIRKSELYEYSKKARYDDREYQLGKAHVIVMSLGEALGEEDHIKQIENVKYIHKNAIEYRESALQAPIELYKKEIEKPSLRVVN